MKCADSAVRPAVATDAADIAAILREVYPARIVESLIYGCRDIAKFVAEQIAVQEQGGEVCYTVAVCRDQVVGYTALRQFPDRHSSITSCCVPTFAAAASGAACCGSRSGGAKRVTRGTLPWTCSTSIPRRGNGIQPHESTSWWQASLPDAEPARLQLIGYPQAQACHEAYGFSQFGAIIDGGHFDVGRYLEKKLASLACLGSQLRPFPGARSIEAVEALAKWRGSQMSLAAAEAFVAIRRLW